MLSKKNSSFVNSIVSIDVELLLELKRLESSVLLTWFELLLLEQENRNTINYKIKVKVIFCIVLLLVSRRNMIAYIELLGLLL